MKNLYWHKRQNFTDAKQFCTKAMGPREGGGEPCVAPECSLQVMCVTYADSVKAKLRAMPGKPTNNVPVHVLLLYRY